MISYYFFLMIIFIYLHKYVYYWGEKILIKYQYIILNLNKEINAIGVKIHLIHIQLNYLKIIIMIHFFVMDIFVHGIVQKHLILI